MTNDEVVSKLRSAKVKVVLYVSGLFLLGRHFRKNNTKYAIKFTVLHYYFCLPTISDNAYFYLFGENPYWYKSNKR